MEGNWAKIETAFGLRETYRKFEATLRAQIPGIDTLEMILHFSREKEDFINERTPRTLYDIEIKLLDAE